MRQVEAARITEAVRDAFLDACTRLPGEVLRALEEAMARERAPHGREILRQCIDNARIAREDACPLCQDTGMAVVFLTLGQDVHVTGGALREAIDEGVRVAYREGGFRASVLSPLARVNTRDNTPAVLHIDIVPGEVCEIIAAPKGFGSENMGRVAMLTPSAGRAGVVETIVDTVRAAGANACPPVIVGVGLGGTMEIAALNSKRALLRPLGEPSPEPDLAALEAECLARVNALGIGPQGLGGDATALAVHCEQYPTHIAGLPVAVSLQCHVARHARRAL